MIALMSTFFVGVPLFDCKEFVANEQRRPQNFLQENVYFCCMTFEPIRDKPLMSYVFSRI